MLINDIVTVVSVLAVCCIVITALGSTMSCRAELNLEAALTPGKADFVIFVDTSYSMADEADHINDNLNAFANFITAAGVDARIIMIASSSTAVRVCIKPPLGRGNFAPGVCTSIPGTTFTPAARSNPPQYVELEPGSGGTIGSAMMGSSGSSIHTVDMLVESHVVAVVPSHVLVEIWP